MHLRLRQSRNVAAAHRGLVVLAARGGRRLLGDHGFATGLLGPLANGLLLFFLFFLLLVRRRHLERDEFRGARRRYGHVATATVAAAAAAAATAARAGACRRDGVRLRLQRPKQIKKWFFCVTLRRRVFY